MATAEDAAAWEALPVEEHKSVWDETERNFWANLRRQREGENNKIEQEYRRSVTEVRMKLSELTGQRSQLSETHARLARELAKVEAELARVTEEWEEKSHRLEHIEQDHRKARHNRVETQQEIWKTMRRFFKEKRGEDPDAEDSEDPDMEGPVLDEEMPEVSGTNGTGPRSELVNRLVEEASNQVAMDGESMEGVEHHDNESAVDRTPAEAMVDVVDADGNVIGPVERIDAWNQWVEGIQELEIRRPVKIRRGRRFNESHLSSIYERTEAKGVKWLSCMIQATGKERDNSERQKKRMRCTRGLRRNLRFSAKIFSLDLNHHTHQPLESWKLFMCLPVMPLHSLLLSHSPSDFPNGFLNGLLTEPLNESLNEDLKEPQKDTLTDSPKGSLKGSLKDSLKGSRRDSWKDLSNEFLRGPPNQFTGPSTSLLSYPSVDQHRYSGLILPQNE
ncbi:hypothetical protein NM208_g17008 [Fusarium decemcellulare]|uniref:Uncharacterized protein n=1 Tax=Fusarium decemcellulare TaxID=57161 RepID=A0ACC1R8P2_9HYPO|nr:hypothetical protein NM208_g17008 [Fusarium decemcellulare]